MNLKHAGGEAMWRRDHLVVGAVHGDPDAPRTAGQSSSFQTRSVGELPQETQHPMRRRDRTREATTIPATMANRTTGSRLRRVAESNARQLRTSNVSEIARSIRLFQSMAAREMESIPPRIAPRHTALVVCSAERVIRLDPAFHQIRHTCPHASKSPPGRVAGYPAHPDACRRS